MSAQKISAQGDHSHVIPPRPFLEPMSPQQSDSFPSKNFIFSPWNMMQDSKNISFFQGNVQNVPHAMFIISNTTKTLFAGLCPIARCSTSFTDRSHTITDPNSRSDSHENVNAGPRFRQPGARNSSSATKPITELQLGEWLRQESGFDRLKMMYRIRNDGTFAEEDTRVINKMFVRSVVVGLFLNLFVTAQAHTRSKKGKNLSGTQALLKNAMDETATTKTVFRESLKNTAKLAIFAGSVLHLSQAIAAYRNKSSVWEYSISSALGFGAIAIGRGPRNILTFTVGGALAGTVCGAMICRLLAGSGMDQEQRHMKRIERLIKENPESVS